ncbi:hypothetical protein [Opitutus sp. ER46]|nr:hypothetical protein [Opitutus sp. ER46]
MKVPWRGLALLLGSVAIVRGNPVFVRALEDIARAQQRHGDLGR